MEKGYAKRGLQRPDVVADGDSGHAKMHAALPEAAGAHDLNKNLQLTQRDHLEPQSSTLELTVKLYPYAR